MKTDEILLKKRRRATPDLVAEIRKFRKKGFTFTELSHKFGLSRSYIHYLCLDGESLVKYKARMAIYSKDYYEEHRDAIIERSKATQARNRAKKAEILKKKQRKKCYIGRGRMTRK
jgi:orotate phosphoribosyltransferase-like protein